MPTETLKDLFTHELRDIYDAENKLVNAIETMANKAGDEKLVAAFTEHLEVTKQQVARLEQIFPMIGLKPSREACKGINGLIEEFSTFVKDEGPTPEVLDVFAVGAAQKVEHYEIVGYQSLIELATVLGLNDAVSLLEETLSEEQETASLLKELTGTLQQKAEPGEIKLPQEETSG